MPRDSRAYLWDAVEASDHVLAFVHGRARADYVGDVLLRSAVERQLTIVGDALNNLSRSDPDLAARVPDLRNVVGFRNILVHGDSEIDDDIVWRLTADRLPDLCAVLRSLLNELDGPT